MSEGQKIDHYHRILPIYESVEECLVIITASLLREADMEIGDEFIALPKKSGLVIKKLNRNQKKG